MRRRGALFVLLAALGTGCADEEMVRPQAPCAMPEPVSPAPAVADSFPIHEARDEATRPAPRLRHSLSLGFVGNEPLSNSVMRDTPMPPPQPYDEGQGQTWQEYIRSPAWGPSYQPRYICDAYRCYPLGDR